MYEDEDKIIKDLLETNIRQRGDIGGSSIKLGRRIKELERIYGIRDGSAGKVRSSNGTSKMTEKDLADQLGVDLNTLKRAKTLANLSPEIQQLIEQGSISASTAARVIGSKLSKEEQTAATYTVKISVMLTKSNNSNKEIKSYLLTQILNFKQFAI